VPDQGSGPALRRCDIDVRNGTVRIERSLTQLPGGGYLFGPPKSEAGRRVVVIPAAIRPEMARHLEVFTGPADDALVFTSPTGTQHHHGNFRRRSWVPALARAGMTGTHFHDLRHTGNALTAATGATLRELMDRMGHSSPRAALIYLHGSDVRQQAIANGLSELAGPELRKGRRRPSGRGTSDRSGTKGPRRIMTDARRMTWRSCELGCCGVGLPGLEPGTSSLSGKFQRSASPAATQVGRSAGPSASNRDGPRATVRSGTRRARHSQIRRYLC